MTALSFVLRSWVCVVDKTSIDFFVLKFIIAPLKNLMKKLEHLIRHAPNSSSGGRNNKPKQLSLFFGTQVNNVVSPSVAPADSAAPVKVAVSKSPSRGVPVSRKNIPRIIPKLTANADHLKRADLKIKDLLGSQGMERFVEEGINEECLVELVNLFLNMRLEIEKNYREYVTSEEGFIFYNDIIEIRPGSFWALMKEICKRPHVDDDDNTPNNWFELTEYVASEFLQFADFLLKKRIFPKFAVLFKQKNTADFVACLQSLKSDLAVFVNYFGEDGFATLLLHQIHELYDDYDLDYFPVYFGFDDLPIRDEVELNWKAFLSSLDAGFTCLGDDLLKYVELLGRMDGLSAADKLKFTKLPVATLFEPYLPFFYESYRDFSRLLKLYDGDSLYNHENWEDVCKRAERYGVAQDNFHSYRELIKKKLENLNADIQARRIPKAGLEKRISMDFFPEILWIESRDQDFQRIEFEKLSRKQFDLLTRIYEILKAYRSNKNRDFDVCDYFYSKEFGEVIASISDVNMVFVNLWLDEVVNSTDLVINKNEPVIYNYFDIVVLRFKNFPEFSGVLEVLNDFFIVHGHLFFDNDLLDAVIHGLNQLKLLSYDEDINFIELLMDFDKSKVQKFLEAWSDFSEGQVFLIADLGKHIRTVEGSHLNIFDLLMKVKNLKTRKGLVEYLQHAFYELELKDKLDLLNLVDGFFLDEADEFFSNYEILKFDPNIHFADFDSLLKKQKGKALFTDFEQNDAEKKIALLRQYRAWVAAEKSKNSGLLN
jgi:hypothetical protein